MMKRTRTWLIALVIAVLMVSLNPSSTVTADEIQKMTGMRFVQLARGGILYDNWMAELGSKIDNTHPSYPERGIIKGRDTWRCKECHGWDYKGKAGAYSEGIHYTGISGIRSYANLDPVDIVKILKNEKHAFSDRLSDNDYDALALFVSLGQIDVDLYINRTTRKSIGDPANGGRIYLATCIKCHGVDGREINMNPKQDPPEYIGTVANNDPYETLHKIRWGHPGTPMVSLLFLELKEQLDVLAFCQALPER